MSMKNLIQFENDFTQSIKLELQMSYLINIVNDRNEKTLPNTFLIIPDYPSYIDRNQESWCLGDFNKESIFSQHIKLDQCQPIDKLATFHFKEIEFEYECCNIHVL